MFKFLLFLSAIGATIILTNGQYFGFLDPEVESWLKSLNFSSKTNPMIDSGYNKNGKFDVESLASDVEVAFEPDVDVYTMDNNIPTKSDNDKYTIQIEDSTNTATLEKNTTIILKNTTKKINTFYNFMDNEENKNDKKIQNNSNSDNEYKNSTDDQLNSENESIYTENETNLLSQYPSKVFLHYINQVTGEIKYDFCGGVLINKTRILTSSFCFDDYTLDNNTEFLMDKNYTENYKVSLFADTLTFSQWKLKLKNIDKIMINKTAELAVLEILEIKISSIVNYGFLQESESSVGDNVTVLQHIHFLDKNRNEKLKEGIFSILDSNNLHADDDGNNNNYYGRYESSETGGCNILRGDPVYQDKNIVGVMQYVHDCRDPESILLFTKIFKHKDWINNVNIKRPEGMVYYTQGNKKNFFPFFDQLKKK